MNEIHRPYALPPDTMVQEYQIIQVLGAGSFGIVYKAKNKYSKKIHALKEFLPSELVCRKESAAVIPLSSETQETYRQALNMFLEEARELWQFADPEPQPNIRPSFISGNYQPTPLF